MSREDAIDVTASTRSETAQTRKRDHPETIHEDGVKGRRERTVLQTTLALVSSVAVHSIKTFFVDGWMRECRPLMMGGNDSTLPALSRITG